MGKVTNITQKDKEILKNLYQNREGLRAVTLCKLTSLKRRNLYKRLNHLRDQGLVKNIFPIWKIVHGGYEKCSQLLKSDKIFELHNLSYVVKLIKKPKWWKRRKNYLMRLKGFQFKNVKFGQDGKNPYQQLINENFVIQAYPESLIIITRKRYYSNNPYETIQQGMSDVLDLLKFFCERFRFDFFMGGIPSIQIRSNDFNRIKDILAEHCKKEGRRFLLEIDKRRRVWIDYSEPFGKEANYPEGQEKLEKVTKDILLKDPMLPSEITKTLKINQDQINQVTQNQLMFAKNIEEHMNVLKDMRETLKDIRKDIKNKNIYK